MTKILNLDELEVEAVKSFVFNGKTHVMKLMDVGDYIKQVKEMADLEKEGGTGTTADTLEYMVKTICKAFPSLKETEARKMTFPQLQALMTHVMGDVTEEMEEGNG